MITNKKKVKQQSGAAAKEDLLPDDEGSESDKKTGKPNPVGGNDTTKALAKWNKLVKLESLFSLSEVKKEKLSRERYTSRAYRRTKKKCERSDVPAEATVLLCRHAYKLSAEQFDSNKQ